MHATAVTASQTMPAAPGSIVRFVLVHLDSGCIYSPAQRVQWPAVTAVARTPGSIVPFVLVHLDTMCVYLFTIKVE